MSLNTTPRTFVAGEVETAAIFNTELRDALIGIQAAWTAYTPAATNFTVGNGTLSGRWTRFGKTALVSVQFAAGTTTTYTASQMAISLPATAQSSRFQVMLLRLFAPSSNWAASASISPSGTTLGLEMQFSSARSDLTGMSNATANPGTTGSLVVEGVYELA